MVAANAAPSDSTTEAPSERTHIIHPGDSLDRLANRYLGDEGRALEIFELNRQVLENPHLLPLGAELRIPGKERSAVDSSASVVRGAAK